MTQIYVQKKNNSAIGRFRCIIYLAQSKSNGSNTLMAYNKPKVGFFLYELIEKKTFYLSMLSDYTSVNIIPAKFS